MKCCILTAIKDEHLYLDEWIKYHLNIGVSHIFLLEDINSKSHKEIIEKYKDAVSLFSVLSILTEEEKHLVLENRAKNIPGGQKTYIKAGLRYIKENHNYDWCFVIDNDEFLTLEENKTLDDVISLYKDYDAFIMSWKCYGANGLIKTPDYSTKGVVDTFTKPVEGYVPATSEEHNKKTCYNLNTYNESFWWTIHVPTEECNYCNTDFKKDKVKLCYTNIYIRHYITKSWEEYFWKKKIRGYFFGKKRTLDNFFIINSDMKDLKKDLLPKKVLVVLPYSGKGSQGNELRLALSLWRKFCLFEYHFVVIGDFDENLKKEFPWVEFINQERVPKREEQYQPHIDIQSKMETAYRRFKNNYDGFIWMVDDNYAIKYFTIEDIKTIHYHELNFEGNKSKSTWNWKHDKWKTKQIINKENYPSINYTTHYPCYFEFERLKQIWDKYDMRNESYVIEDIYFNSYEHEEPILDSTVRLGIWDRDIFNNQFQEAVKDSNIKFVCNSVMGWSKELEEALWKIICEQ